MALVLWELLLLMAVVTATDDDWISKCGPCKCLWSDGKKTADCSSKYISTIPSNLSDQIRYLDLSNNPIYELGPKAFLRSNLQNIQKLKLQNCSIETVHPLAFSNLGNLIELDLSKNNIIKLDEDIFKESPKLRLLFLNHNKLKDLRGKLFHGMPHLQRVEVNNNEIQHVDVTVFDRGPVLQHIDFSENRLKRLDVKLIQDLARLSSINVQGNLWICDCKLKAFRDLAMDQFWVTTPTACAEPKRLKDQLWSSLQSKDFACAPKILETNDRRLEADALTNYTISCKVRGDPIPDVDWVTNGRIIDRDPRQSFPQKYVTFKNSVGDIIWNNLTIISINYRDRGEYKCVAKNPGGVDEKNLTLIVYGGGNVGGAAYGTHGSKNMMPLYIGLICAGAIILVICIFVLIFCCCRRKRPQLHTKSNEINQSSDYISLNGRPELEKALITDVNPIVKPPRQYSVPASVISGVTEVSDIKKTLLDNDSTYGVGDDDSRSFDFDSRNNRIPTSHLDVNYRGDSQLPPDLLTFPACTTQVSPAGSNASTVPDQTRLPAPHGPQTPVHSPIYDTVSLYRTLPYSRSQSPFTTPLGVPVVMPRHGGYVTIPRRPRASWSSEPIDPLVGDPVYDNLGLRTSASGHSALSLNKLGEVGTPRGVRPQLPCDPIAEHESIPVAATLPRNISASYRTNDIPRAAWLRNTPETSSLRSVDYSDSRRESTSSLLPPTPDGKISKIPPRPPPKPRKRVSAGPLFEDEGEDGTEV